MKSLATILSLAAVLGTSACMNTPSNPNRPMDTGNMAYPSPQPQGTIGTTRPATLDTGSMNMPTSTGIATQPAVRGGDTGNMALPTRAQGNSRPGSY